MISPRSHRGHGGKRIQVNGGLFWLGNNSQTKPPVLCHFAAKGFESEGFVNLLPLKGSPAFRGIALSVSPPSTCSGRTDKTDHGEFVEPCEPCVSVVKKGFEFCGETLQSG